MECITGVIACDVQSNCMIKCTKAWFAYYVQPNIQTLIRLKLGADKLGLEVQSNSQIKSSYSLI